MNQLRYVRSRNAPPRAPAMIEALRGLGYSTPTALADIIDNSIAAGARTVDIGFVWKGSASVITILDDGCGMDDAALERAMRLGERSPVEERSHHDLGRFGLGLKTASFSQCRRLTVASRTGDTSCCLRWDLDYLAASPDDGWHLLEDPAPGSEGLLDLLQGRAHGTLVIWEVLDRVVRPATTEQHFLDLIDSIERHLAMVFQRFLTTRRVMLRINGRAIKPWDPFLADNPSTWHSQSFPFLASGHPVTVQGFVLPHKDRLDPATYETAGGPDGWVAQQGFYVYRNERLLVAGSWLGLGQGKPWPKDEPYRLARIRLDLSNSADSEWNIDVRKSKARPPPDARLTLFNFAQDIRARARNVFAWRGRQTRTGSSGPVVQAWSAEQGKDGMRYRIDETHPAIAAVLEDAGALEPRIRAMLRIIQETVPVQRIWLDTAEARDTPRTGFAGADSKDVNTVLEALYGNLVRRKGLSPEAARQQLLRTEPFQDFPELVSALPDTAPGEPT